MFSLLLGTLWPPILHHRSLATMDKQWQKYKYFSVCYRKFTWSVSSLIIPGGGGGGYSACQVICIGSAGKKLFQPPWYDKWPPFFNMVRRTTSFLAWYGKWPLYVHIWCRIMQFFWRLIHVGYSCRVLTPIFSLNVESWPLYFLWM